MFAIIATGGKQINVEVGKEYFVEKITGETNETIIFNQVLMIDGTIGKPLIEGAEVHATIIKQDKAKKIIVFKYKPKKNSKTKYGHRQPYTKVKITDIFLNASDKAKKEAVKKDEQNSSSTEASKNIQEVAQATSANNEPTTVNNLEKKVVDTTDKK